MKNKALIDKLNIDGVLTRDEFITLFSTFDKDDREYAASLAREIAKKYFGNKIYIRGLIEVSSFCKNDCFYCGLRASNKKAERYRLSKEDILACCKEGYDLGFRTFVLQGGEDGAFTDKFVCDIVREIKSLYPDCAVTLSLGERSFESYKALYDAGADRYLLRHETATDSHYKKLHPENLTLENRKRCLYDLKKIGFQTGCGFMVGAPGASAETYAEDFLFIKELSPQMVGIGPFLPHCDTPFANMSAGDYETTLFFLSLIRIMEKRVLLPATTALGTLKEGGREQGILSGANVVMPNLSPLEVRKKYMLYNNKISTGDESAQSVAHLKESLAKIGYEVVNARGDYIKE